MFKAWWEIDVLIGDVEDRKMRTEGLELNDINI